MKTMRRNLVVMGLCCVLFVVVGLCITQLAYMPTAYAQEAPEST